MSSQYQPQESVIAAQPSSNNQMSAKDQEIVEGMDKWKKIREQRRAEQGLPPEGQEGNDL